LASCMKYFTHAVGNTIVLFHRNPYPGDECYIDAFRTTLYAAGRWRGGGALAFFVESGSVPKVRSFISNVWFGSKVLRYSQWSDPIRPGGGDLQTRIRYPLCTNPRLQPASD